MKKKIQRFSSTWLVMIFVVFLLEITYAMKKLSSFDWKTCFQFITSITRNAYFLKSQVIKSTTNDMSSLFYRKKWWNDTCVWTWDKTASGQGWGGVKWRWYISPRRRRVPKDEKRSDEFVAQLLHRLFSLPRIQWLQTHVKVCIRCFSES